MPSREELLAKAKRPAEDSMRLHPFYKGKVQVLPKCAIRTLADFAIWYTPGVAAPCQAIQRKPELDYDYTNKANSIAIVSDGSRVLGLGNIGPEAGLPVMEGKALLFKYLGGVDPAGIIACDSKGTLHRGRADIEAQQAEYRDKWRVCNEMNCERVVGGIGETLRGADVCIAFSQPDPDLIRPAWVKRLARDAIVFACANPLPEIWPWDAQEAGARIVATGRSDFANQLNNSLCFPAIFRGVLDVRARTVTDEMTIAAAQALAAFAEERGMHEGKILPRMDEWAVFPRLA